MKIEDNLLKIDSFLKNPNRTLFDGRLIQSSINQDNIFYLLRDNDEILELAKKIQEVSELEQDSLMGIEDNLKELAALIKKIISLNN